MEDTHVHALDYVSVLRRRKWWLVVPIVASIVVGAAAGPLPAEAVQIERDGRRRRRRACRRTWSDQSAPLDNDERMRAVSQQLLSSRVLTRVAREAGLSVDAGRRRSLGRLRSAVTHLRARSGGDDRRAAALRHVHRLLQRRGSGARAAGRQPPGERVRRRELEGARSSAPSTPRRSSRAELAASQSRLAELEARLRRAKESHIGQLPEQTQANLQTLSGLRQQIDANATALRGEQDRALDDRASARRR